MTGDFGVTGAFASTLGDLLSVDVAGSFFGDFGSTLGDLASTLGAFVAASVLAATCCL